MTPSPYGHSAHRVTGKLYRGQPHASASSMIVRRLSIRGAHHIQCQVSDATAVCTCTGISLVDTTMRSIRNCIIRYCYSGKSCLHTVQISEQGRRHLNLSQILVVASSRLPILRQTCTTISGTHKITLDRAIMASSIFPDNMPLPDAPCPSFASRVDSK